MTTILLIRHAENEYVKKGRLAGRLSGVHLNDRGVEQAGALARRMADMPIHAIYSSPLERAMETAEPLAKARNLKIITRPGLQEVDFGTWQGKTLKQLRRRKLWPTVQSAPTRARFPDGESFAEAQVRICQELESLRHQHKPKHLIAAVSHSDMIKLAAAYYLGLPLDLFQRLSVFPASITTLVLGEQGARLININQIVDFPPSGTH